MKIDEIVDEGNSIWIREYTNKDIHDTRVELVSIEDLITYLTYLELQTELLKKIVDIKKSSQKK